MPEHVLALDDEMRLKSFIMACEGPESDLPAATLEDYSNEDYDEGPAEVKKKNF